MEKYSNRRNIIANKSYTVDKIDVNLIPKQKIANPNYRVKNSIEVKGKDKES